MTAKRGSLSAYKRLARGGAFGRSNDSSSLQEPVKFLQAVSAMPVPEAAAALTTQTKTIASLEQNLTEQLLESRAETKSLREKLDASEAAGETRDAQNAILKQSREKLKARLAAADAIVKQFDAQVAVAAQLQAHIEALTIDKTKSDEQRAAASAQLELVNAYLEAAMGDAAQLREEARQAEKAHLDECTRLAGEKTALQAELTSTVHEFQAFKDQRAKDDELALKNLKILLETHAAKVEEISNALAAEQKAHGTSKEQLAEIQNRFSRLRISSAAAIEANQKRIKTLEISLKNATEAVEALTKRATGLDAELDRVKALLAAEVDKSKALALSAEEAQLKIASQETLLSKQQYELAAARGAAQLETAKTILHQQFAKFMAIAGYVQGAEGAEIRKEADRLTEKFGQMDAEANRELPRVQQLIDLIQQNPQGALSQVPVIKEAATYLHQKWQMYYNDAKAVDVLTSRWTNFNKAWVYSLEDLFTNPEVGVPALAVFIDKARESGGAIVPRYRMVGKLCKSSFADVNAYFDKSNTMFSWALNKWHQHKGALCFLGSYLQSAAQQVDASLIPFVTSFNIDCTSNHTQMLNNEIARFTSQVSANRSDICDKLISTNLALIRATHHYSGWALEKDNMITDFRSVLEKQYISSGGMDTGEDFSSANTALLDRNIELEDSDLGGGRRSRRSRSRKSRKGGYAGEPMNVNDEPIKNNRACPPCPPPCPSSAAANRRNPAPAPRKLNNSAMNVENNNISAFGGSKTHRRGPKKQRKTRRNSSY